MIVPTSIRRKFALLDPTLEELEKRVRDTVGAYCYKSGFAYVGRRKTLESLAEKIETGRFASWSRLDDLYACAIIIPTLDHEESVLAFLAEAFSQIDMRKRGSTLKPPDAFRFDMTRFIARLRPTTPAESSEELFQTNFEIQVRSAFEHAWSVTTHAIYKSHSVTWKTERLAAQLKAAVEQLDSLVRGLETSSQRLVEHEWPDVTLRTRIVERFSDLATRQLVPDILIPKDWSRFASNLHGLIKAGTPNRNKLAARVETAINHVEHTLTVAPVPFTLSLFQFVFAVISREGTLELPLKDFSPLVTQELIEFCPEISRVDPVFLID
jgi:ppGpp synthetase/RelA/SpoT-type nucleotidyltranferase